MSRIGSYLSWRRKPSPADCPLCPRVVAFDFDGTIADTFGAGFEILNKLADEFGFRRLAPEDIEHARDMRTRELMKFLGISTTKMSRIARRGSEELSARINDIRPLPGVSEALRAIHERGYILGIITSNTQANVAAFLQNHDLDIFSFVRSSSKLLGKSREIRAARREAKVSRSEILFIGDETRDISAAQKDGVAIAAVTWGYNSAKSIAAMKPDFVFHSPQEIVDLLDKLPKPAAVAKK